ncbi:MAG: UvrD-helicase domain-containing protein [Phycisphaerales bacterium]|nr:UvrD-helicase domain-containing protein [Phycisphaerales bacterium]
MRLTETQAQAVSHRDGNLLISASAGSGKTEVLARRVVQLLADAERPCPIDAIAVVTFTRAAAAELRERVARMLRERAASESDAALRRNLHIAEALIDAAQIGTIDSWCGRIVREHFADAGVDPAYRVLAEQEAALLRARVLDELFEWVFTADAEVATAAREWLRALPVASDEPLRDLVQQMSNLREQLLEPEPSLARRRAEFADERGAVVRAERVLRAGLSDEIGFQRRQLDELLAGAPPTGTKLHAYREALEEWHAELGAQRPLAGVLDRMEAWKAPHARRGQPEDPRAAIVLKRWWDQRLRLRWTGEAARHALAHASTAARRAVTLIDLEAEYERRLREAKRRLGALEFGDVLRRALELLGRPQPDGGRQPTEIARLLQRRYQHILIDEYQDTSPVQVEILRLLSREAAGETNRFMVGDVKQSIYGFRKAEPSLFTALLGELDAGRVEGRALFLTDNFRSRAGLLNPLNDLFAALFDSALGGTDYQHRERLIARRADPPGVVSPNDGALRERTVGAAGSHEELVQVVLLAPEDSPQRRSGGADGDDIVGESAEGGAIVEEPPEELERAEREALLAAQEIRRLMDQGATVPQAAGQRPAQFSDFAILLRSARQNASRIAAVLRRSGIPAVSGGQEALLRTVEGRDVRALLALLCNRRQDLALASWLRSPFVGLREPLLAELRAIIPRGPFHRAVLRFARRGPEGELRGVLRGAFERLESWRRASRELELPDLLRRIFRDSGYELFVRGLHGGAHRAATLDALIELADRFAGAEQHGPAEFYEYLESLAAINTEPSVGIAPQTQAVRVMTIHASKGLEFPFTILLCSGARFNRAVQRQSLFLDDDGGLGLRTLDLCAGGPIFTAEHLRQSAAAWERHLSEEMRLLYVAATRARERLWIFGHCDPESAAELRESFRGRAIPRITRFAAGSLLDWVLLGVGSAELDRSRNGSPAAVCVREWTPNRERGNLGAEVGVAAAPAAQRESDEDGRPSAADWARAAHARITGRVASAAAKSPVALSVSAIKQLANADDEEAAELPAERDGELFRAASLARPAFARSSRTADPRDVGLAVHRFFETCDLATLNRPPELERSIAGLVASGRLAAEEAALLPIEDIRWFCGTPEAALLASHADRCRRELPFVRALPVLGGRESVLVRGIADCVIDTDAGIILLDYKTDRLPDAAALQRRFEEYCVQLQHYRAALQAAWDRPVARSALIFLAARRVMDVPPGEPPALEFA